MGYEVYTDSGKTIEITSDASSLTVSVSGFGSVNYERQFYMYYKKQSASSYSYLGDNSYLEVAASAAPPNPWTSSVARLDAGTAYSIKIVVYGTPNTDVGVQEVWSWEKKAAISTDVKVPIPYIDDVNSDYGLSDVRVYWGVDEHISGTTYTFYVKKSGGSYYEKESVSTVPSKGYTSIEVDSYNTTYYVYIEAEYNGEIEETDAKSFKVNLTVPTSWSWTNTEKNAFNNKGLLSAITRTRWNNFITWARDVIAYINARDSKSYAQIPTAANMGTDKILYADSWNAVDYYSRIACGDGGHEDRVTGDVVKGSYFISLTDVLNNEL